MSAPATPSRRDHCPALFWPKFYCEPVAQGKNVWLFLQLACIVLYAIGTVLAFTDIRRASHLVSAGV